MINWKKTSSNLKFSFYDQFSEFPTWQIQITSFLYLWYVVICQTRNIWISVYLNNLFNSLLIFNNKFLLFFNLLLIFFVFIYYFKILNIIFKVNFLALNNFYFTSTTLFNNLYLLCFTNIITLSSSCCNKTNS